VPTKPNSNGLAMPCGVWAKTDKMLSLVVYSEMGIVRCGWKVEEEDGMSECYAGFSEAS